MNQRSKILAVLFVVGVVMFAFTPQSPAQSTNADFQQAVTEYQKSPSADGAGKVIKLAVAMDKLPSVPEEARKHFVKGAALFKEAKSPADFTQVLDEFKEAARLAPGWPEARYNFALACESAGEYPSAMANLKLYQLFKLPDAEARSVQDKIYVLEAKTEKTAKESSPEAVAAKNAREQEEFLKRINGAQYVCHYPGPVEDIDFTIDVLGNTLTGGQVKTRSTDPSETKVGIWEKSADTYKIDGRALQCYMQGNVMQGITGIITDDGSTITIITRASNGYESRLIYKRER